MVAVRTVPESDVETACRLHNRFHGNPDPVETLREWRAEAPGLFVGAYDDDEVVGICTGHPHDETGVHLAGLGVVPSRRREGIGSRLVERFEENAAAAGYERVSLGSAGGYVDRFYLENGYDPVSILVRVPVDADVEDARRAYDVREETVEGDTRKLYVDVDEVDPAFVDEVREAFDDEEAIHVFAKSLAGGD